MAFGKAQLTSNGTALEDRLLLCLDEPVADDAKRSATEPPMEEVSSQRRCAKLGNCNNRLSNNNYLARDSLICCLQRLSNINSNGDFGCR